MNTLVDNVINHVFDSTQKMIVIEYDGIKGAAYYAPENFTEGVYNVYFIGVQPEMQGQGVGTELLKYIEKQLRGIKTRILLIETSSLSTFEKTWKFYLVKGYTKEATIKDYYKEGEDKIIFSKKL